MKIPSLSRRALAALLILLAVAAYLPAIGAGYIWDDDTLLTSNPQMRSMAGLAEIWLGEHSRDYTPLTLTSFWMEWHLWGATPTGYHVVNILLHAISAVLLWRILERLRIPGAWLGALLFAVHPINAASVAWIAERKNTLSGAFFLGSVLCYLAARDGRKGYIASIALFAMASLSKGAVVTMPAVLLLCVLWRDRKVTTRDLIQVIPFVLIAFAAALLTIRFQARAFHYGLIPDTFDYRISRAGAAIWFYLGSLLWPAGMSPIRAPWLPDPHSILTYVPALAVATALLLFFLKRRAWGRPPLFAFGYFLIMLVPVLGFVWMTLMQETPAADWWQYMAAPGVFALAGAGIALASRKGRWVAPVAGIAIALLLVQTWRRASIYQSLETYCRAVIAEDPHAWTLQNNLGILLKRQGRFPEAEACYRQALRDNPGYVEAHINLGNIYGAASDPAAALAEFQQASTLRPGDPTITGAFANLGAGLLSRGDYANAETAFRRAVALAPDSIVLRIELCQALNPQGKKTEALQICAEVDHLAQASRDPIAIAAAAKLRSECEAAK